MDMLSFELERHPVRNIGRYDTHPKLKTAVRDHVEQMRHKSGPLEIFEMAYAAEESTNDSGRCSCRWVLQRQGEKGKSNGTR